MKLSCRDWSGAHLSKGKGMKSGALPAGDSSRSVGSRSAGEGGVKRAGNAQAAQRKGEESGAHEASSPRASGRGEKKAPRSPKRQ
jgi:hypothetical protein